MHNSLFDYNFDTGKNFKYYCPENNKDKIIDNIEIISAEIRKSANKKTIMARRESKLSNFMKLRNTPKV